MSFLVKQPLRAGGGVFLGLEKAVIEFAHAEAPAKEHSYDGADSCLQDLIRKLEKGIFRRTVKKGSSEGIAHHHNDGTDADPDSRG